MSKLGCTCGHMIRDQAVIFAEDSGGKHGVKTTCQAAPGASSLNNKFGLLEYEDTDG
jgi:hypothetical protein